MAVMNYLLAALGILGLMMFQMYMSEKKKKKESEILKKREEKRWEQVEDEMSKRSYIEGTEEYKNKEAEFFLKFEAGEKVYFYITIRFIGQGRIVTDGGRNNILMGTVLLTDKQLIILNRDDISSYKTSEIGYIDLHFEHIHIYVPGKDICFYLNMRDIALIEKLAGKLNIKVKKADELINPTPDPDFDKEIERHWWRQQ
jgi:hypothetical protein